MAQWVKNLPAMQELEENADSIPGSGGSLREANSNPLQYSCLENPHGQRSLAGCSPWGPKELDMTERLSTIMIKSNSIPAGWTTH